ncbi:MAG: class I SAM-dependent methyltransferase [Anaerolineae bacterium]|jgi:SAM-dependent methyltransferase
MIDDKWYVNFFDEDYLCIYGPYLSAERTEQEVEQIVERLGLPPGSAILDLCCGHGRHSIALAERGYRVVGQDLSEVFLKKARADAAEAGVQLRWVHADMRDISFEGDFDAVINMFSAFGYLESEEEDLKALRQVRRALKPGGLFLLEIIHRAWLVRNFESRGWHFGTDGVIVLQERELNLLTGRNEVTVTLIDHQGSRRQHQHAMRIYSAAELVRMVRQTGLTVEAAYGGLDGRELKLDSNRLVLLARK